MNKKDAWTNFISSGRVSDYLRYASIKNEQSDDSEEQYEVQYRRTDLERNDYKGTGQVGNYSDKK